MALPTFRDHPDPIATGAFEASDRPCQICGQARGFRHRVSIHCACRTPGYSSWQQEVWATHCRDACAFLGDAPKEALRGLSGEEVDDLLEREGLREADWRSLVASYTPGGNPAVYHWRCLHCRASLFTLDFT